MSPRRNWDSPTPSLASECAPPPGTKGASTHACGWGVEGVPIPTTGEKLSTLPTLWAWSTVEGLALPLPLSHFACYIHSRETTFVYEETLSGLPVKYQQIWCHPQQPPPSDVRQLIIHSTFLKSLGYLLRRIWPLPSSMVIRLKIGGRGKCNDSESILYVEKSWRE